MRLKIYSKIHYSGKGFNAIWRQLAQINVKKNLNISEHCIKGKKPLALASVLHIELYFLFGIAIP